MEKPAREKEWGEPFMFWKRKNRGRTNSLTLTEIIIGMIIVILLLYAFMHWVFPWLVSDMVDRIEQGRN